MDYSHFKVGDKRDIKGRFVKGVIPFDRTGILHTEETKKKLKITRKGRKPSLGMKHTKEMKMKMSIRIKKEWFDGLRVGHSHPISNKQKEFLSKSRIGKKNPAWKGGIVNLTKRIRKSYKYRQWRSDVFTRDNFTCQECVVRGRYLEAHHIKDFAKILAENNIQSLKDALACEELWNINNGRTFCKACHEKTKKYANNKWKTKEVSCQI